MKLFTLHAPAEANGRPGGKKRRRIIHPEWLQMHPRLGSREPNVALRGARIVQRGAGESPEVTKVASRGPKMAPKEFKMAPRGPKMAQR